MTTVIRQDDLIESVAEALQFISYYHPKDFIQGVHEAYLREESQAAKDAMAQILINSRMCAQGKRPLCQDTGIVTVFVTVGMDVQWDADMALDDIINEGVRRAYKHPDNVLRASILADPDGARTNTKDNTPAIIHYKIVPGNTVDIHVAAKGGRFRGQGQVCHAESVGFSRGMGVENGPADGRRLVPAGDAGHRYWRHG